MARRPSRQAPPPPPPAMNQTPREPATPPRWLRPAILLLAAMVLTGWFSTAAADSDTWWHLKTASRKVSYGLQCCREIPMPPVMAALGVIR